ncbi:MAG: hypothetical protein NTZ63_01960 [Candidatus Omnitrophica bacterium]|nr:hypothetical protein [Candidatus Omnitrophota bacterium]
MSKPYVSGNLKKKVNVRLNIVILIISLIASFVLLDVFVRIFRLAPEVTSIEINKPYGIFISSDNPRLKYVPKPNCGDINKYGIRDRFYSIDKPNDVFRILVLGDSIGFGLCTDKEILRVEDTFAKVLERELNQVSFSNFKSVEVINLSVSGYDTIQEVEFLKEKGLIMQPDIVIIAYCLNDSLDASAELGAFRKNEKWIWNYAKNIYLKSSLTRVVYYRLKLLKDKIIRRFGEKIGRDRTYVGFKELRSLSDKYKFKTLVVIFPLFEDWNNYSRIKIHEKVQLEAKNNNFYCLDLYPIFKEESGGNFRSLQGRCSREHLDECGHKAAAFAIKKYILDHESIK